MKIINWIKKHSLFIVILVCSLGLHILSLLNRGDFSFDETFSTYFSSLPWIESLKYWTIETNPPLHMLLLRLWIILWGNNEIAIRFLSTIFNLLSLGSLYYLVHKWYSKNHALLAVAIMSLSDYFIVLGTEARTYSLLSFLTIFSCIYFLKITQENNISNVTILTYSIIQLLLLYSHLTSLLIIILQILITILIYKEKEKTKKIIQANLWPFLLFLVWLIPSIIAKLSSSASTGWFFNESKSGRNLMYVVADLFVYEPQNIIMFLIVMGFIGVCVYNMSALRHLEKTKKNIHTIIILWALTPMIAASLLGIHLPKYITFSLPAISILFAFSIISIPDKKLKISAIIIFISLLLPYTYASAITPLKSYRQILSYIEKNKTEHSMIMTVPFNQIMEIKRYYTGTIPLVGVYPRDDDFSFEERTAKFNWQEISITQKVLDTYMEEKTKDTDTIFFIQYAPNLLEPPVPKWFITHGWKLTACLKPQLRNNAYVFMFQAPNYQTSTSTVTQVN